VGGDDLTNRSLTRFTGIEMTNHATTEIVHRTAHKASIGQARGMKMSHPGMFGWRIFRGNQYDTTASLG
jgi:hypothetical protein